MRDCDARLRCMGLGDHVNATSVHIIVHERPSLAATWCGRASRDARDAATRDHTHATLVGVHDVATQKREACTVPRTTIRRESTIWSWSARVFLNITLWPHELRLGVAVWRCHSVAECAHDSGALCNVRCCDLRLYPRVSFLVGLLCETLLLHTYTLCGTLYDRVGLRRGARRVDTLYVESWLRQRTCML